jgi:hypothetical protein
MILLADLDASCPGVKDVYVAPTLGVNFMKAWRVDNE